MKKYWDEYYSSVELALNALQARHDGRTNDFESLIQAVLFDQSLREAIRHYETNGRNSEVDWVLRIYVYRYVVDEAGTPSADSRPYDARTIGLFRKIAALQPTAFDTRVDPEIETIVAKYTEQSIREYEVFVNQTTTNETIHQK